MSKKMPRIKKTELSKLSTYDIKHCISLLEYGSKIKINHHDKEQRKLDVMGKEFTKMVIKELKIELKKRNG